MTDVAIVKDLAVVLRCLDYSETSQVLAVLTREHGQQRLIAKGVKRAGRGRPAVGIDLLELGRVVFSRPDGREERLGSVTEWRQERSFAELRRNLGALYAGLYAADVTAQLTEIHDPHPRLFELLVELCDRLGGDRTVGALCRYLWAMLTEVGLRPELARCTNCGRSVVNEKELFFSSHRGGAVCRDCEPAMVEKRRVSPAVARALAAREELSQAVAPGAFDLLDYHLTEISGRRLKLSELLRGVWSI